MQGRDKNTDAKITEARERLPIYFHVEADRLPSGVSVSIMGVLSIVDFNESSAIMKMRRGKIRITGSGLSVAVYENRTVEISGKVGAVEFL